MTSTISTLYDWNRSSTLAMRCIVAGSKETEAALRGAVEQAAIPKTVKCTAMMNSKNLFLITDFLAFRIHVSHFLSYELNLGEPYPRSELWTLNSPLQS